MTTYTPTNTFVDNTKALASKVNQNFTDLATYLNTNAILKDASVAFTAVPSGPAVDPTTANQLARKAYVDAQVTAAAALKNPRFPNGSTVTKLGGATSIDGSTNQIYVQAGYQSVTMDSFGQFSIAFPVAFPTGCLIAIANTTTAGWNYTINMTVANANSAQFKAIIAHLNSGGTAGTVDGIAWLALGY